MLILILCLVACCASPPDCRGDGKVFRFGAGKVEIPDQDALIVWRDGQETLAIETRFVGSGRDFAWVVPLPGKPEISPGTTGLFPTLRALCAPRVVNHVHVVWPLCIWATVFVLIAMAANARSTKHIAIFLGLFLPLTCFVFLPSLGRVRGGEEPRTEVWVLERQVIGSYDVATVASSDPGALGTWLKDNGFEMAPAAQPVIADYVKAGWVFVASKLRRDEDTLRPCAPHPLVFKFSTKQPVYPLRLTAVENGPLKVDLYVFGPDRAAAKGFVVKRCAAASPVDVDSGRIGMVQEAKIGLSHPGLVGLVGELAGRVGDPMMITRLSATLSPGQMSEDAVVSFAKGSPYLEEFYSNDAAMNLSVNVGAGVLIVGVLFTFATTRGAAARSRTFRRVMVAIAVSCVAGGVAFAATPSLPHSKTFTSGRRLEISMNELAEHLWSAVYDRAHSGTAPTENWVREQVPQVWEQVWHDQVELPSEGDSPGCYSFRVSPEGALDFMWHDSLGQAHRLNFKATP